MRYILPISLLVLSCSGAVSAQQSNLKQWFNSVDYTKLDSKLNSADTYAVTTHYYFEEQQSSGVWDDFGYLDTDSNIGMRYFDSDNDNTLGAFGEGFYGNVFATFEIADIDNSDNYSLGLGYLFTESLKVSARMQQFEYEDTIYLFEAQYNHQINDTDYIGFTIETDDEIESWDISSRYFAHLTDDNYLALDVSYLNIGEDPTFNVLANYYFSKNLALGIGSNDSDLVLEGKYFFNNSYYLTAGYTDYEQSDVYSIKFVAQF